MVKKRTASQNGRRSRTKGHSFERWVANQLRVVFPNARRHLEYHSADANGVDIINTGFLRIQCKKLKKYAQIKMIEEIKVDPLDYFIPILITAADGKPPMVVMSFEYFMNALIRLRRDAEASLTKPKSSG